MPHPLLTIQSLGRLPDGTPCTTLSGDVVEIGALRCFGRYHLVPEGESEPAAEPTPAEPVPEPVVIADGDLPF